MGRKPEARRGEGRGARTGVVVETKGRRVVVEEAGVEVLCFLAGQRAVLGDEVRFEDAPGEGGKLTEVLPRRTTLMREKFNGTAQILAANLEGLLIVAAAQEPPFRPGLVDRYAVAARASGLEAVLVLHKVDQGVPDEVERALAVREAHGLAVLRTSCEGSEGIAALETFLAEHEGTWALVGHSGVGKTSLVQSLLPGIDVGAIGALSEHWGTGQHTTTRSRHFRLPAGGQIADSPGIRTFLPGDLTQETVREHFYGVSELVCKYRDCLHRPDEQGCQAESALDADLLVSYRRLLDEVGTVEGARRR